MCKSCVKIEKKLYDKKYYMLNQEKKLANAKEFYNNNKEKHSEYYKNYNTINKKKVLEQKKLYDKTNLEKKNKYLVDRRKNDPLFKIICNYKSMINNAIKSKNYIKKSRSHEILGCTFEFFKLHLESKFETWMTWDNKGNPKDGIYEENKTWDIDHIIPLSTAKTEEEVLKLNHYSNLQPLCSYYNRFIKKDNI
jgi:hypothetical protein